MFRLFARFTMLLCASALFISSSIADTALPKPQQKGGDGIFDVLKNRRSFTRSDFPTKQLSKQDLSNLLWAASGQNRPDKGWTIPLAHGNPPYNKVYVLNDEGVFLYDWKNNALKEISKENVKAAVGTQPMLAKSPAILAFVADGEALRKMNSPYAKDSAWVATGAMTQNVYLAAASMNIGVRYIASLKPDAIREKLKLDQDDIPMSLLLIGNK